MRHLLCHKFGSMLWFSSSWTSSTSMQVCLLIRLLILWTISADILECEVKGAFGSITRNKASEGDGIPDELFQILKDDAVKVLHLLCQQIWKTQQRPWDWKRSVFISTPKEGNAKEYSNYQTIALISHASKVMLKILQARLQQYVNRELPCQEPAYCILSAYCILHIECSTFHSIIFQDLEQLNWNSITTGSQREELRPWQML